jgi:hypothetical protein
VSKLYIAVLDEVPDYITPTLVAHSVLAAHLKFSGLASYDNWLTNSFRKVVLKTNKREFEKIKQLDNVHEGYENKTLNGEISCLVVCPREDYPNVIRFAKMWRPSGQGQETI